MRCGIWIERGSRRKTWNSDLARSQAVKAGRKTGTIEDEGEGETEMIESRIAERRRKRETQIAA